MDPSTLLDRLRADEALSLGSPPATPSTAGAVELERSGGGGGGALTVKAWEDKENAAHPTSPLKPRGGGGRPRSRNAYVDVLFRTGPLRRTPSLRSYLLDLVSPAESAFPVVTPFTGEVPPFACAFSRGRAGKQLLAVVDEDGMITLLPPDWTRNTVVDGMQQQTQWQGHMNAIFDVAWRCDDRRIVTASGDQSARLWDIETRQFDLFEGHRCSVKAVSAHPTDPHLYVTAARDGNVAIWDVRCSGTIASDGISWGGGCSATHARIVLMEPDAMHAPRLPALVVTYMRTGSTTFRPARLVRNAHATTQPTDAARRRVTAGIERPKDTLQSVTAVLFLRDAFTLATGGATDGTVKLWDLRDTRVHSHNLTPTPADVLRTRTHRRAHGISSLALDHTGARLLVGATDNSLHIYDCGRPTAAQTEPLQTFSGHGMLTGSFYVKSCFSPDDRWILSGSKDFAAYVWEVDHPGRAPLRLSGHDGEVTAVAWNPLDLDQLVTCSDDMTVRLWKVDHAVAAAARRVESDPDPLLGVAREATPATPRRSPRRSPVRRAPLQTSATAAAVVSPSLLVSRAASSPARTPSPWLRSVSTTPMSTPTPPTPAATSVTARRALNFSSGAGAPDPVPAATASAPRARRRPANAAEPAVPSSVKRTRQLSFSEAVGDLIGRGDAGSASAL